MKKIFVLGVGCQKGGTTWLHNYLSRHPAASMGFRKEYHVFDALHIPECRHFLADNVGAAVALHAQGARWLSKKKRECVLHAAFYADQDVYYDYFAGLVADSRILLTGDITPSYSGLPAAALEAMKLGLESRGFDVRVVFLMRDPVRRCVSAMRMDRRKHSRFDVSENDDLARMYGSPDFELRTRYEMTISNLEKVFSPERIFYGFYEELFTEKFILDITDFLRLPHRAADFEKQINVDKSSFVIEPEILRRVYTHYHSTYDFMANRFGRERMAALWSGYAKFGHFDA